MSKQGTGWVALSITIDRLKQHLQSLRRAVEGTFVGRLLIGVFDVLRAAVRDVVKGELSLHATSLVYTTLLAIVPLLAVSFSVLKGFGVQNQLRPALEEMLAPLGDKGPEITDQVIGFVNNVQVVALGAAGLVLLFYTVVQLLRKIEGAVNYSWHVSRTRSFGEGFSRYLSIILVGPVLVFSSMALTATLVSEPLGGLVAQYPSLGAFVEWGGRLTPYGLLVIAFSMIYKYLPNTEVTYRAAFAGGLVAAMLWYGVSTGFTSIVAGSPNYVAIYAAFAALVVLMIWLYVSWLVLLFGASVAFYTQFPYFRRTDRRAQDISANSRERLGLIVMKEIAAKFVGGERPPSIIDLAIGLGLPMNAVDWTVNVMTRGNLLRATVTNPPGYVPARSVDGMMVREVLEVVRTAGDEIYPELNGPIADEALQPIVDRLKRSRSRTLDKVTVRNLVTPRRERKSAAINNGGAGKTAGASQPGTNADQGTSTQTGNTPPSTPG